jgi:hypothetical protein
LYFLKRKEFLFYYKSLGVKKVKKMTRLQKLTMELTQKMELVYFIIPGAIKGTAEYNNKLEMRLRLT